MGFRRGVALVPSVRRVVELTSAMDLRNLEATGELRLEDLLVTASDAIFDRLVVDGIRPEALRNPEVYERAVAFQFLGLLAAQGYLGGQEDPETVSKRQLALSDRYYEQVRPQLTKGNEPRTATEGLPWVVNIPHWGLL